MDAKLFALLDGMMDKENGEVWGQSAIGAILAICIVFVVLIMIITITFLIFKWLGYFDLKKEIDAKKKSEKNTENSAKTFQFNENDEDMVAAVLVATIDYRNEIKKDVKLVSVKEIK